MPNTPLHVKVPGKVMVAGEYAVLEKHQKSVVMAVDRFVYASLQTSVDNQLILKNLDLNNLKWSYHSGKVTINTEDKRINFVQNAMKIALNYLEEQSIVPGNFTLSINSELDDISGIKYGLGSSAAVVASVITIILRKYLLQYPSTELIFKLAAISHVQTQGNGSGADVAASAYGGILEYASFQANWLKSALESTGTLTELLEKEWIYLSVKQLELPKNIDICIGWTGSPAYTGILVEKMLQLKENNLAQFQEFLLSSKVAVESFIEGMRAANIPRLLQGIKQNRNALALVGEHANVEIETDSLCTLSDLAEEYGGAGKPSGAGGGDCGIVFISNSGKKEKLLRAWRLAKIKPLTMHMYITDLVE